MISAVNTPLFFYMACSSPIHSLALFRLLTCNTVVVVAVAFIWFAAGVV